MSLDVSEAIALAKDLLKTGSDFRTHNPEMAAEFSTRAYEICDDLGIDRTLVDDQHLDLVDAAVEQEVASPAIEPAAPDVTDDEVMQSNDQMDTLLERQARVLQNVRETEKEPAPAKTKKRGFRLFKRSSPRDDLGALQSA